MILFCHPQWHLTKTTNTQQKKEQHHNFSPGEWHTQPSPVPFSSLDNVKCYNISFYTTNYVLEHFLLQTMTNWSRCLPSWPTFTLCTHVAVLTAFKCHCLTITSTITHFNYPTTTTKQILLLPYSHYFFSCWRHNAFISSTMACCTILVLFCSDHHHTPWERCEPSFPHHTNIISLTGAVDQLTALKNRKNLDKR